MIAAERITRALGAANRSGAWWCCVCPMHGSRTGRSATLAQRDGDRGIIVHCHAGCDARDILAELRRQRLLGTAGGYPASRGREWDDILRSRERQRLAGAMYSTTQPEQLALLIREVDH